MTRLPPALILAAAVLLSAACSPRSPAPPPSPESPARQPSAETGPARMRQTTPQEKSVPGPGMARPHAPREDPLYGPPSAAHLPGDFTLGPLQGRLGAGHPGRVIHDLLTSFFSALFAGKPVDNFLHPDYRSFLLRSLKDAEVETAVREVRIGELLFSGNAAASVQAGVLVIGNRGRARGELLAERQGEKWYISGIALDFSDLARPHVRDPGEIFDPGPVEGPF